MTSSHEIRNADRELRSAVDRMYDVMEEARKAGEAYQEAYTGLLAAVEALYAKWKSVEPSIILPIKEMVNEMFTDAAAVRSGLIRNLEKAAKPETPYQQAKNVLTRKTDEG